MLQSSSKLPAPGRLFLPGCAIAAGLLAVSSPVIAAPTLKASPRTALVAVAKSKVAQSSVSTSAKLRSAKASAASNDDAMTLRVGKTVNWPISDQTKFTLESGGQNVHCEVSSGTLTIKALSAGEVRMRLSSPKQASQLIRLSLVEGKASVERRAMSQVVPSGGTGGGATGGGGTSAGGTTAGGGTAGTGTTPSTAGGAPAGPGGAVPTAPLTSEPPAVSTQPPSVTPATPSTTSPNAPISPVTPFPGTVDPQTGTNPGAATAPVTQTNPATGPLGTSGLATDLSTDLSAPPVPTPQLPGATAPSLPALGAPVLTTPTAPAASEATRAPQISSNLPAPSRSTTANVNYRTAARLPQNVPAAGRQSITVTQGLARLLSFPSNILAVFFSDPNVMDARAINARTIAVTGIGPGPSTLAVFTSRYPGDAVGRANVYRIQTTPKSGTVGIDSRDPRTVETAIASALGDPRIRTSVLTLPNGTLAARLAGNLRNDAEVQAAVTTASFFVPQVISSLYADPNAPTLDTVLAGPINTSPEGDLQETLRRITGNQTIEILPLPTGLGFKAEVDSAEEAEGLLRVLPTLNQQVIPFIVVRGQGAGSYYNATVPLLSGEDRQLTQKLQDVTGVRTVYAVRTASNGLACYGTVRTRSEYDNVRRYMMVAAQTSTPVAIAGTSQGGQTLRPQGNEGSALASYNPTGGYRQNLGLQMFVRITDPAESVIRKVTVETNIVEISRTALRNLGVEYGTATLTEETITPGQVSVINGAVVTTAPVVNREIDAGFNRGTALAGNGFAGLGPTGWINPFRARLNAIVDNGDARILAQPNVTSVEGSPAQITIGGERPVPRAVATQGAVGTQVEFRRYGVIISMRPTVSGDNGIILQIRADITQPDRTFEINLNGALIPGETVRSVDTVINVRPGDTIVMGGLITNEKRQQTSKVPILGDLPVIGSLFRSRRFENNETELAIFMTPRIQVTPTDMGGLEDLLAAPSFPALPSRQDANSILFQDTARAGG